jgi:hypothetical protein
LSDAGECAESRFQSDVVSPTGRFIRVRKVRRCSLLRRSDDGANATGLIDLADVEIAKNDIDFDLI